MAIFQKAYQGYEGDLTPPWQRLAVVFRYALADVFQSRLFLAFYLFSFLPLLVLFCVLYTYYNVELLLQFEIATDDLFPINGEFFMYFLFYPQSMVIFVLILAVGPIMISPDLRNNAMPLYLSRPLSKSGYIIGKLLVLLLLCSLVSWIPGVLLILFQAYLAEPGWLADNIHILVATIVTFLCWMVSLSLLAFAVSAFVKWKAMARMVFFGVIFIGSALGEVIYGLFGGWAGSLVDLSAAVEVVASTLFMTGTVNDRVEIMPLSVGFAVFAIVSALAAAALARRIRAYQVVS